VKVRPPSVARLQDEIGMWPFGSSWKASTSSGPALKSDSSKTSVAVSVASS